MSLYSFFFFFNDTATTEIYTLSLHDALPISPGRRGYRGRRGAADPRDPRMERPGEIGRAHVWNSSHDQISYAVFCLKKKKKAGQIASRRPTKTRRGAGIVSLKYL